MIDVNDLYRQRMEKEQSEALKKKTELQQYGSPHGNEQEVARFILKSLESAVQLFILHETAYEKKYGGYLFEEGLDNCLGKRISLANSVRYSKKEFNFDLLYGYLEEEIRKWNPKSYTIEKRIPTDHPFFLPTSYFSIYVTVTMRRN